MVWNWNLKKIQARTGFEPVTSAMPVQCSANWAIKPTGSWPLCEFIIYPYKVKNTSEYTKVHIFELRRITWRYARNLSSWVRTHDLSDTGAVLYNWAIILRSLNIWTLTYPPVKLHFVTKQACEWENVEIYVLGPGRNRITKLNRIVFLLLTAPTYLLFRNRAMSTDEPGWQMICCDALVIVSRVSEWPNIVCFNYWFAAKHLIISLFASSGAIRGYSVA